eukprot:SAG31_NODE_4460_length_3214_cov_1.382665_2_plen_122_part_00
MLAAAICCLVAATRGGATIAAGSAMLTYDHALSWPQDPCPTAAELLTQGYDPRQWSPKRLGMRKSCPYGGSAGVRTGAVMVQPAVLQRPETNDSSRRAFSGDHVCRILLLAHWQSCLMSSF